MPDGAITLRDIMSKRTAPLWEDDSITAITPVLKQLIDTENSGAPHEPVTPDTLIFDNGKLHIDPSGGAWDAASPFTPPEVREGQAPDARSDVYAVCAILKYMTTGSDPVPFDGGISPESAFDALVLRGLSANPDARFESVTRLCVAINGYLAANDTMFGPEPEPEYSDGGYDDYDAPQEWDQSDGSGLSDETAAAQGYPDDNGSGNVQSGAGDVSRPLPKEAFSGILDMPDEPKPKSKAPIIIAVSIVAVLIAALAGTYFITYSMAVSAAKDGDFGAAGDYLLMEQITNSHDPQLVDYIAAGTQLGNGEYAAAIASFEALSGYLDSDKYAMQSRYKLAGEQADAGDYDSAIANYRILADAGYSNANALWLETRYDKIESELYTANDYESIVSELTELVNDGSNKAADLLTEAEYLLAGQQLENGEYENAMNSFKDLGTYSDSMDKYFDAMYLLAKQQLEDEDYESAVDSFKKLVDRGGFDDAPALLSEAKYGYAKELAANGETLEAYRLLNEVDESVVDTTADKDALAGPLYAEGEECYDAGSYEDALEIFEMLVPYSDSQRFVNLANAHLGKGDYASYIPEIMKYLDFKDAALVVVLNQNYANIYLCGDWETSEGEYYFSQSANGSIGQNNLLWNYDKQSLIIKNGVMYGFNEGEDTETYAQFKITPVSATSVRFYFYSDGSEHLFEKK